VLISFPRARTVMEAAMCAWGSGVQEAQEYSQGDSSGDFVTVLFAGKNIE